MVHYLSVAVIQFCHLLMFFFSHIFLVLLCDYMSPWFYQPTCCGWNMLSRCYWYFLEGWAAQPLCHHGAKTLCSLDRHSASWSGLCVPLFFATWQPRFKQSHFTAKQCTKVCFWRHRRQKIGNAVTESWDILKPNRLACQRVNCTDCYGLWQLFYLKEKNICINTPLFLCQNKYFSLNVLPLIGVWIVLVLQRDLNISLKKIFICDYLLLRLFRHPKTWSHF